MSSPAQVAANIANAQHSTRPRTEQDKTASSQNATPDSQTGPQALSPHNDRRQTATPGRGLFSTRDFIRPGEESLYAELTASVRSDLAPVGELECMHADEIRRAIWRLRRCAETEAAMVETCVAAAGSPFAPIPDPLQKEATASLQLSVDRARAQSHRLIHRSTAELRKLQTERFFRQQETDPTCDPASLGLADLRVIRKSMDETNAGVLRKRKINRIESDAAVARALAMPFNPFTTKQTRQPGRNSRCTCGSGMKFKRCCALKVAA